MVGYRNTEGYMDPVPYLALGRTGNQYRPLVYICFADSGDVEADTEKAKRYCRFAYEHGAIPIVPQLLFPQFMDGRTEQDQLTFMCIAILSHCKEIMVFGTPTAKMRNEIAFAERKWKTVTYYEEEV